MKELKKKVQDIYDTIEALEKKEKNVNMTDEEIIFLEKTKFDSFFKGYILASLIEK